MNYREPSRSTEDRETTELRERSRAESVGCPECGGYGTTSRYVAGLRGHEDEAISIGAICHRCIAGDFIRSMRESGRPSPLDAMLDLKTNPEYQDEIYKLPPAWYASIAHDPDWTEPRKLTGGQAAAMWQRTKRGLMAATKAPGAPIHART
jgi:hypothetical protein